MLFNLVVVRVQPTLGARLGMLDLQLRGRLYSYLDNLSSFCQPNVPLLRSSLVVSLFVVTTGRSVAFVCVSSEVCLFACVLLNVLVSCCRLPLVRYLIS